MALYREYCYRIILGRKNEWLKVYDPARPIGNKEKDEYRNGNRNSTDNKNKKDENIYIFSNIFPFSSI